MEDKKWTVLIIFGILLLSGAILYFNNQKSNELVLDIGENATLYVSSGCSHCIKQLKILGECPDLNIVDCTKDPKECLEAGIIRVPTWIINGKKYGGVQSIDKLRELFK